MAERHQAVSAVTLPNIKSVIDTAVRDKAVAETLKDYFEEFKGFCAVNKNKWYCRQQDQAGFDEALGLFETGYKKQRQNTQIEQPLIVAHQFACSLILKIIYHEKHSSPDYELGFNYFIVEFPQLDERTRSNTVSSFTVLADSMLRGEFLRCFGAPDSSFSLESLYREGRILIVDQDVKRFGLVGQITAAIIKLCFERMIERREDITRDEARPVFLWADEAQYFSLDNDQIISERTSSVKMEILKRTSGPRKASVRRSSGGAA